MNIDITKKYTTRDGRPVLIYAVYPKQSWGIHGAVVHEDGRRVPCEWHHDGSMAMTSHELDLIPAKTWRAWTLEEAPKFFMARRKTRPDECEVIQVRENRCPKVWLDHYTRIHEDGSETPCGVESL